jgi:hypothetical protein
MASIALEPRMGGGGLMVALEPCAGAVFVMTMPEGTRIFEDEDIRGVQGPEGEPSLTIHRDGTLEYDSPDAEYSLTLPPALAGPFFAAFEGRNGQALEEAIVLPDENAPAVAEDEEENPRVEENPQGGRKRRSRVKKQTRRTQRKRRNTVRR